MHSHPKLSANQWPFSVPCSVDFPFFYSSERSHHRGSFVCFNDNNCNFFQLLIDLHSAAHRMAQPQSNNI